MAKRWKRGDLVVVKCGHIVVIETVLRNLGARFKSTFCDICGGEPKDIIREPFVFELLAYVDNPKIVVNIHAR